MACSAVVFLKNRLILQYAYNFFNALFILHQLKVSSLIYIFQTDLTVIFN